MSCHTSDCGKRVPFGFRNHDPFVMRQCWFLHTTRFGPDVVTSTLCCEEDDLPNLPGKLLSKKLTGIPRTTWVTTLRESTHTEFFVIQF